MNRATPREMNGDTPLGHNDGAADEVDDRVVDLLAQFDEALLSGSINQASVLIDAVPNELSEIVHTNQEFLALLHEAARAAGSTIGTRSPSQAINQLVQVPKSFGRFQVVRELGHGSQELSFSPLTPHSSVMLPSKCHGGIHS